MPIKGKVCKLGVWDESVPGINFDAEGISNYAHIFQHMLEDFPRGEKGAAEWDKIVSRIKQDGHNKKYDCIIGLSGGTDSSYLLHVAKEYGLRPLAVNLDNGWGSHISMNNIKKLIEPLKVDLETYVIDYEEVIDVLKAYLRARLPWCDCPTDLAINAILFKIAYQQKIKYVLIGHDFRSEGFQPTEWTYSDAKQMKYLALKFANRKLISFPSMSIWLFAYLSFIKGIKLLRPFFYIPYSKKDAKNFLKQTYNWEDYGGHHYENIFTKFIISFWLYEKFGIDKRKITYSAQILSGEITRDEAIAEIERLPYDKESLNNDINYIIKKLRMKREEFEELLRGNNCQYYDYPSYYPLFIQYKKQIFNMIKYFLPNKPLMFYQLEKRERK